MSTLLAGQASDRLSQLHQVVPTRAALLAAFDDERRRYVELSSLGFDRRTREHLGRSSVLDRMESIGVTATPAPRCSRDSLVPLQEVEVWAEYYLPAGFRDGLAVGLFTPDRRHVGLLVMCADRSGFPTVGQRSRIAALAPLMAAAVNPVSALTALAKVVQDARAGAILDRAGDGLPLPGLPGHPLLRPGSELLSVALGQTVEGQGWARFLWPATAGEDDGRTALVQVSVLGTGRTLPEVAGVVVLSRSPGDPCLPARRELVMLGLLIEGWSEERIATALKVPLGTVAGMVERVVALLGARDLHAATLRAVRRGWFIPFSRRTDLSAG
ncbi:helix-turn-helix domain-containing protein [Plantactinospora sonchi]|uniref:HTH luxR-type domain-containing protein n=1 Tax=Plantactinospora sonchi TaxID=1544735 RepID=A0ABU7RNY0_9ACTN